MNHPVLFGIFCACYGAFIAFFVWRIRRDFRASRYPRLSVVVPEGRIACVCLGGPLDGMEFTDSRASVAATFDYVSTGAPGERRRATYRMTYRAAKDGRWIFEHEPNAAKIPTP